jgi:hypothetical protein
LNEANRIAKSHNTEIAAVYMANKSNFEYRWFVISLTISGDNKKAHNTKFGHSALKTLMG